MADPTTDPNFWSNIAQLIGSYEGDAAKGRVAQAGAQNAYDNTANSFYKTAMDAALKGPSTEASQAARGDILQSVQPASFSNLPSYVKMPTLTGGLSPANLGPSSRAAGALLSRNALLNLAGNKFGVPTMPTQTPLPTPSGLDKGLSAGALVTGALGALGGGKGNSTSFSLPFSGYNPRFGTPGDATGTNDYNGNLPSYGDTLGSYDTAQTGTQVPNVSPSDTMAEYYAWLAQQGQGGSDASPDPGDWGNP